ncbi:hypothetical protein MCOR02_002576 [Pyricularia oryzae]|nr:hypothetical protein MCOR02_002576 [Pyricularia oryzae]
MSAGSGPMAGLVLGWESGTQRGWGRARASLALLTAARGNIRCRVLMEIAAPIQRKHESSCPMKLFYHVASANETHPTTAAVTCGGGRPLVNAVLSAPAHAAKPTGFLQSYYSISPLAKLRQRLNSEV